MVQGTYEDIWHDEVYRQMVQGTYEDIWHDEVYGQVVQGTYEDIWHDKAYGQVVQGTYEDIWHDKVYGQMVQGTYEDVWHDKVYGQVVQGTCVVGNQHLGASVHIADAFSCNNHSQNATHCAQDHATTHILNLNESLYILCAIVRCIARPVYKG